MVVGATGVCRRAGSFVCFAGMQYGLLKPGVSATTVALLKMTFASQAPDQLAASAAARCASVYGFRWYRRFGADDTLAAWSLVGASDHRDGLALLGRHRRFGVGGGEGASLDLIPVIIGVMLVTGAIGALFVYERPLVIVLTWAIRASQSILRRPRGDAVAHIQGIMHWVTSVHLRWRQVLRIVLWGTANWLFDCACFAMMFLAVGSAIPWKGLLLAYGAGQLAAALPITPGGLGAVEGSITIALVAFGGAQVATVDAVLMYRLISFWLVLAVGWSLWGELAFEVRKGRWRRAGTGGKHPGRPGTRARSRSGARPRCRSGRGARIMSPMVKGTRRKLAAGAGSSARRGVPPGRLHVGPHQSGYIRQRLLSRPARRHQGRGSAQPVHRGPPVHLGLAEKESPASSMPSQPNRRRPSGSACLDSSGPSPRRTVYKPLGLASGSVAVVISKTPSNQLPEPSSLPRSRFGSAIPIRE